MEGSKAAHAAVMDNMSDQTRKIIFCEMAGDIVEQFEETCSYEAHKAAYANTAALFMQGFFPLEAADFL